MTLNAHQRQVLVAVGKNCRPNSEIKGRRYTESIPFIAVVKSTVGLLRSRGLVEYREGRWWQVRPTAGGYRQIEIERESRQYLKSRAGRVAAANAAVGQPPNLTADAFQCPR